MLFLCKKEMEGGENMKEYKILICKKCRKTTIVLSAEVDSERYLVCSHCSSKNLKEENETDNFKECMKHTAYKREHGAIRQVI